MAFSKDEMRLTSKNANKKQHVNSDLCLHYRISKQHISSGSQKKDSKPQSFTSVALAARKSCQIPNHLDSNLSLPLPHMGSASSVNSSENYSPEKKGQSSSADRRSLS